MTIQGINFETFTHDRMRQNGKTVIVNERNICFGASAIRSYDLEDKKSVQFQIDPNNPYILGFKFHDSSHKDLEDSYKLVIANGSRKDRTATRQCSSAALYRQHKQLRSISEAELKSERVFLLKEFSKKDSIYYIELTPSFEYSAEFSEIRMVPKDAIGIYRIYDKHEQIVYIGSGYISSRAIDAQKRSNDQFKFIEYSLLDNAEKAMEWERFHQERFVEKNGDLPKYNKIYAPKKGNISQIGGSR